MLTSQTPDPAPDPGNIFRRRCSAPIDRRTDDLGWCRGRQSIHNTPMLRNTSGTSLSVGAAIKAFTRDEPSGGISIQRGTGTQVQIRIPLGRSASFLKILQGIRFPAYGRLKCTPPSTNVSITRNSLWQYRSIVQGQYPVAAEICRSKIVAGYSWLAQYLPIFCCRARSAAASPR